MSEINESGKYRYWQFVIYPESAPSDFKERLKATHAPFALSPLHTPDDENAKPHHHCMYCHGNPVAYSTVYKTMSALGLIDGNVIANGHIEPAYHPHGAMRYLIHLDDEEKQQFPEGRQAIEVYNSFPLDLTRELTKEELRLIRARCFELIAQKDVLEYSDLVDLTLFDDELNDYVCSHTILFNSYLASKRNRDREADI